ncbi:MAG: DUF4197 domain-containing protein [Saprospirales bacterium]|nr:MAG: DUF4197 domain-containing protein [Saprospirales bacterium]
MKKSIIVTLTLVFTLLISACSSGDVRRILEGVAEQPLTTQEVALGLKEALNNGVESGVNFLSVRDGFLKTDYKIFLPSEARVVTDRLQIIPGFSNVEEIVIERINRAAEDAVGRAAPIFKDAILSMSIQDAWGILQGEDDAATQYLITRTRNSLYFEFQPVILDALNKFDALDYWESAVNRYNSIPFVDSVNPRLDDYVTNRAMDALFGRIAIEELAIREDVSRRTSDLLKRVFARQDKDS